MSNLDWALKRIVALPEFQRARRILELGAGSFARSVALAEAFPEKTFHSTDLDFPAGGLSSAVIKRNLHLSRCDMHDMPFRDGYFDFSFSVALMEHIADVPRALSEMHRVIAENGMYYFIQAPFWSCAKGHHFLHWKPEIMSTIPLFGHLYLTREQMTDELRRRQAPFGIEDCVSRIYDRFDLSRLTRHQTYEIVQNSSFRIASWEDYPDTSFDAAAARSIEGTMRFPVVFDEMHISGAYVALKA